jgi:hypothetical protein
VTVTLGSGFGCNVFVNQIETEYTNVRRQLLLVLMDFLDRSAANVTVTSATSADGGSGHLEAACDPTKRSLVCPLCADGCKIAFLGSRRCACSSTSLGLHTGEGDFYLGFLFNYK